MLQSDSERFWDEKARENPLFYVDNELDYDDPDLDTFWRHGEETVDRMLAATGLELGPEDTLVDIGCGVGRLTRVLAGRTARVFGLDVSQEMLELAQQYNPQLDNVIWLHGDGSGLGVIADGTCDGCFSHVVFQHIPEPEVTLNYVREMGRVLRVGGWALFQVSTNPEVHTPPAEAKASRRRLGRRRPRADPAWWGSAVPIAELRSAAEAGGLEIERLLDAGSQFTTVLARRRP